MKKYLFKPYSKHFPELFEKEKERIRSSFGEDGIIEHIGSTAIPDLGGKGIIDIAIAVSKEAMDLAKEKIEALGYEFRPTFSSKERYYFIIYLPDSDEGIRRYHIHLTYKESNEWKDLIGFREYLRRDPKEVALYADVKKKAALESNQDGALYRKLKEPIFQRWKRERVKKITIIGLPGSGKSTFAVKLGEILGIPVHHLDTHQFIGNGKRDREEFLSIQREILGKERWIIEGCSFSTIEMRFSNADVVIYLQYSRVLCFWRIIKRLFSHNPYLSDGGGCLKGVNWALVKYVWNFTKEKGEGIEAFRKKYPQVEFHLFKNDKDANRYLDVLSN